MTTAMDFEEDSKGAEVGEDGLTRIMNLADLMVQQEKAVEAAEKELKDQKEALRRIQTETLPTLMDEYGMASVKLKDGSTVEVVKDVQCAITEANRDKAHNWLIENGFGGLIKTSVTTEFGRGEIEAAVAYAQRVNEFDPDHPAQMKDGVHAATLKSFIKEQMAAGAMPPTDLFSIFPFNKAKYKPAK